MRPGLAPEVDALVMRAMAREAGERFQQWAEFSRELAHVLRPERSVARKAQRFADSDRFETLRTLAFFQEFSDAELWEVAHISTWRHLEVGQALVECGALDFRRCAVDRVPDQSMSEAVLPVNARPDEPACCQCLQVARGRARGSWL